MPAVPQPELHIASLVVHAAPRRAARIAEAVAALPGAQVHAVAPNGKLVVTLEEEMYVAAEELRFEYAAKLRDEIKDLRRELQALAPAS